ncbi:hypothetical protein P7K49_025670, partial [Saguinus oedipus]
GLQLSLSHTTSAGQGMTEQTAAMDQRAFPWSRESPLWQEGQRPQGYLCPLSAQDQNARHPPPISPEAALGFGVSSPLPGIPQDCVLHSWPVQ